MKPVLLLSFLFVAALSSVFGETNYDNVSPVDVISSEEIRDFGLIRLGDIIFLADKWNINTTDGYTWDATSNGLSPFLGADWQIMLDGQLVNINILNVNNINMLPLSADIVDSAEIISIPQIFHGEFADRGILNIRTKKTGKGLTVRGYAMAGNETGDPGPYKYTKYASPNVDRIGKDGAVTLDYGAANWHIRANLCYQEHTYTGFTMRRRVLSIDPTWNEMERIAPSVKLGLDIWEGEHELYAGYSNAEKYYFFFKPLSREIPVDYNFVYGGIHGTQPVSENFTAGYSFAYTSNDLMKHPNNLDFDFDLKISEFSTDASIGYMIPRLHLTLGTGYDRLVAETGYTLDGDSFDIAKAYGDISFKPYNKLHQNIGVMVKYGAGKTVLKSVTANKWNITPGSSLEAVFSYSQRLIEENNSLWYWADKGYGLLETNDIEYKVSGDIKGNSQYTGDISWAWLPYRTLDLGIGVSYRRFDDLYLERYYFDYEPGDSSFTTPVCIFADEGGEAWGSNLFVKHEIVKALSHDIYYGYRTNRVGDDVFKEISRTIPENEARYRVTFTPVNQLTLWAALSHTSATYWADYENLKGVSEIIDDQIVIDYSPTVPSFTTLDLSAKMSVWKGKLDGSILVKNIWNEDYRYHPVGASFDLSIYVKFAFALDAPGK